MHPEKTLLPEWAPQSAVMLTWPHERTDWADMLADIENVYVQMVEAISPRERLLIVCNSNLHKQHILQQLSVPAQDKCIFAVSDSDDSWCRDHGPICITENHRPLLLDFQFNGWGNKFAAG